MEKQSPKHKNLHVILRLEHSEEGWVGCIGGDIVLLRKPEIDPESSAEKAINMAKWWVLDELASCELQAFEDVNHNLWIEDPGDFDAVIFEVQ